MKSIVTDLYREGCDIESRAEVFFTYIPGSKQYWDSAFGQWYPGDPSELIIEKGYWCDDLGRHMCPMTQRELNYHEVDLSDRINDLIIEDMRGVA